MTATRTGFVVIAVSAPDQEPVDAAALCALLQESGRFHAITVELLAVSPEDVSPLQAPLGDAWWIRGDVPD